MEAKDYLPISMLNQLEYCERRFYLMHVWGEMEVNAHVAEGIWRHLQAHSGQGERQGETLIHRKVYVWSDRLRVSGFCDVVEEQLPPAGGAAGGPPLIRPVEYKKGRMGEWLNDHIQLCAQAVCLEERLGIAIPLGYLYYFGSRRRQEVSFTPQLRGRLEQATAQAQALIQAGRLPPPLVKAAKCQDCSLRPVCLPQEVRALTDRHDQNKGD